MRLKTLLKNIMKKRPDPMFHHDIHLLILIIMVVSKYIHFKYQPSFRKIISTQKWLSVLLIACSILLIESTNHLVALKEPVLPYLSHCCSQETASFNPANKSSSSENKKIKKKY